jgi:2-oxoisovalerate dehydrogenase E1 component alpha subunit
VFLPTYREQGVYLARGVRMAELLQYWGGDERGMAFADVPDDFPVAIPIATHLPHAVGVAWAFQYRRQPRVAVAMCGDGATSKGDFYEAINAAGVWQLPCVFVVVNNGWAISVPRSAQTRCATLAQKAVAAGIPGEQVDGNDVIAVFERVSGALERARNGGGPSLVEAISYRMTDHTTADDASRYRDEQEVRAQAARDPIDRLHRYLVARGALTEASARAITEELELELEAAVNEYLAAPRRATRTMFDCLYETLPDALLPQLEERLREHPDEHPDDA